MATKREHAARLLENCKETPRYPGCLIWQGAVDEKGYGLAKVDGKMVRVHRYIALYSVDRPEDALTRLERMYMTWDCEHTLCCRVGNGHLHFNNSKAPKEYEDASVLREMVAAAGFVVNAG